MGRGTTTSKFRKDLALKIKAARIAAGYGTQREFAAALGVDIEAYKKYESGRTPIPHEHIPRLCELTNQDANYFFGTRAKLYIQKAG